MTNKEAVDILVSGGFVWDLFPRLKPAVIMAIESLNNELPKGEWLDRKSLLEELEKEVESADDWYTAHELYNVVKYFPHYGGAYEGGDDHDA